MHERDLNADHMPDSFTTTDYAGLFEQTRAELADLETPEPALPGFENEPRSLSPIEDDPVYQEAQSLLEPFRDQLRAVEKHREELLAADERDEEALVRNTGAIRESREIYKARFNDLVQPILRARLGSMTSLPYYDGMAAAEQKLGLAAATDHVADYGDNMIDVSHIIASPSLHDWSGLQDERRDGKSYEKIVDMALSSLRGDFDLNNKVGPVRVSLAITPDKSYVYLLEDGSHRVGAAKLLGLSHISAQVKSYNFDPNDPNARAIQHALSQ